MAPGASGDARECAADDVHITVRAAPQVCASTTAVRAIRGPTDPLVAALAVLVRDAYEGPARPTEFSLDGGVGDSQLAPRSPRREDRGA